MTPAQRRPSKKRGPAALTGSLEAKRQAAVILEVLSGLRSPTDGSQALGVSLPRYYVLETRALQGLIGGLEPLPRGRQSRPQDALRRLEQDKLRLERELGRTQALLRAAQRAIGVAAPVRSESKTPSGRKRRRPAVRAMKTVAALRAATAPATAVEATSASE